MISVLIPCYDFNALPLVKRLEKEALTLGIAYEIVCIDDGSFSPLNEKNQQIKIMNRILSDVQNDIQELSVTIDFLDRIKPVFDKVKNDSISLDLLDQGISRNFDEANGFNSS